MTRLLLTPRWIAFTLLMAAATVACMVLGWWQFQRYREGGGSFQNLGYTLNWPLFGAFAAYLWWRLLRDAGRPESHADDPDSAAGDPEPAAGPRSPTVAGAAATEAEPARGEGPAATAAPRGAAAPDDPELAAYNRYLAELAERSGR